MLTRTIEAFREEEEEISVSGLCRLIGINRLDYYRGREKVRQRKALAEQVVELVQPIRNNQPMLGGRKLYHLLHEELRELKVGRDKLFDILRANNMLIKPKKAYQVTTNSHHRFKKHKDQVAGLVIDRPEQVWVSDITYIGNRENPVYLALVTDAYSKQIMGHDVSASLDAQGCVRALKRAAQQRSYSQEELIHHSDRGIQYCSNAYQDLLKELNISCSMTESYDPYANAIAERVNGILKQEFLSSYQQLDLAFMQEIVRQSIEIYNHQRPHWSCELLTPMQMHAQREIPRRTYEKVRDEGELALIPEQ